MRVTATLQQIDQQVDRALRASWSFATSAAGLAWILVVAGAGFRVNEYAGNRSLFLDESTLSVNLIGHSILPIKGPLNGQLAAPAFLATERAAANWLGPERLNLRLFPLVCSLAALPLFMKLARRVLSPWAATFAVALFVLSDDLIYYSSEIKQYSSDVLAVIACWLVGLRLADREASPRALAAAAALGLVVTWYSHPSIFVLAGVASWLTGREVLRRHWRTATQFALLGAWWALSFLGCYLVSRTYLEENSALWPFWNFAFLPLPPHSWADAATVFRHMLNLFVNPVNTITPLGPLPSAGIGLALTFIGGISLGVRKPAVCWMLLAPLALAILAASLRSYPFHARLVLYLLPAILILIAEGVSLIAHRVGKAPAVALALFLLVVPVYSAIGYLSRPHMHVFDAHGDLRRDLFGGQF